MTSISTNLRSLYRSFLRELPHRPLSTPSPIQQRIREAFSSVSGGSPREEANQFIQYLKAQRMYVTLLERYNPGMLMDEEERVRLTARRVGMDLPEEWRPGQKSWVLWNSPPVFGYTLRIFCIRQAGIKDSIFSRISIDYAQNIPNQRCESWVQRVAIFVQP